MAKRGRKRTGYLLATHYRIVLLKQNIKTLRERGCEREAAQCERELKKLTEGGDKLVNVENPPS